MRTTIAALVAMIAGIAVAAISPRQDYVTDCSQPPVKRSLTFVQASSQQLGWTFQQGTTAKDLTGATSILFVFSPSTRAWSQTITGSLDVATNGSVLVAMTPTQLNTNTATTGALDWMLYVADTTQTLAYAYGKLNLITDPSQSVTNTFAPASPNATEAWVLAQGYGTGTGNLSKAVADVTYAPITSTGETSKAYVDQQDVATSNGIVSWVGLQGYGTGNLSKATADVTYLPLATGGTLRGDLTMLSGRWIYTEALWSRVLPTPDTYNYLDMQAGSFVGIDTTGPTLTTYVDFTDRQLYGSWNVQTDLSVGGSISNGAGTMSITSTGVVFTVNGTNNWYPFK